MGVNWVSIIWIGIKALNFHSWIRKWSYSILVLSWFDPNFTAGRTKPWDQVGLWKIKDRSPCLHVLSSNYKPLNLTQQTTSVAIYWHYKHYKGKFFMNRWIVDCRWKTGNQSRKSTDASPQDLSHSRFFLLHPAFQVHMMGPLAAMNWSVMKEQMPFRYLVRFVQTQRDHMRISCWILLIFQMQLQCTNVRNSHLSTL